MNKKICILLILSTMLLGGFQFFPSLVAASDDATLFKAKFKEIGKSRWVNGDYAIFTITYSGERDIDDISLSLSLKNTNGETLSSSAVSDQTPGVVWLKAGASKLEGVPLDNRPKAKLLMETKPEKVTLVIEVNKITFMGN